MGANRDFGALLGENLHILSPICALWFYNLVGPFALPAAEKQNERSNDWPYLKFILQPLLRG